MCCSAECAASAASGINESHKSNRPGIYEYQTVAACDFIYADMGSAGQPITPSLHRAERGLIWHYNANNHLLETGTVLLIDYAPN